MSGCGSSGDSTIFDSSNPSSNPLAYRYVKLIKSGDPLPGGARLAPRLAYSLNSNGDMPPPFMGAVQLTDSRHVYFHALDENQTRGIYRIDVDANGARSEVQEVIREGSVLPDGTVVKDFSDGDVNNGDDFVVVVENPEGTYKLEYARGGASFSPVVSSGGSLGNVKLAEDIDQYQSVADDGTVLFVSEYMDDEGDCQGEGLFVMPASRPEEARRVLAKGDLLPGTSSVIETFGATEINSAGFYLVQGSARPTAGTSANGRPLTFLLRGVLGQTPSVLALDPALGNPRLSIAGAALQCPRLSPEGNASFVLQTANEDQSSMFFVPVVQPGNGRVELARADIGGGAGLRPQLSPRGARILSFLPPVFGPRGLIYFQVFTDRGMELIVRHPRRLNSTVLARGDVVDGKRVETIIFGALPDCVNSNGEFAAIVEFDDGETDVYLGIPV